MILIFWSKRKLVNNHFYQKIILYPVVIFYRLIFWTKSFVLLTLSSKCCNGDNNFDKNFAMLNNEVLMLKAKWFL